MKMKTLAVVLVSLLSLYSVGAFEDSEAKHGWHHGGGHHGGGYSSFHEDIEECTNITFTFPRGCGRRCSSESSESSESDESFVSRRRGGGGGGRAKIAFTTSEDATLTFVCTLLNDCELRFIDDFEKTEYMGGAEGDIVTFVSSQNIVKLFGRVTDSSSSRRRPGRPRPKPKRKPKFTCTVISECDSESTASTMETTAFTTDTPATTLTPPAQPTCETPNSATCSCGTVSTRIVGGSDAQECSIPWQILLLAGGSLCGASLLSPTVILTAAHCVDGVTAANVDVLAGVHDINNLNSPNVQQGIVSQVILHPSYNPTTAENDIALITLDQELSVDNCVTPICLPSSDFANIQETTNLDLMVSGWGTVTENGNIADILQEVLVPTVSLSTCMNLGGVYDLVTSTNICAGQDGLDSCQGDSGGPLTTTATMNTELVGVVSFGAGCARPNMPGVYAYVPSYLDWISSTLTSNGVVDNTCSCT